MEYKIKALKKFFIDDDYDDYELEKMIDDGDYLVLNESERDDALKENIENILWAFNASFLAGVTNLDQSIFDAIQANNKCEDNNEAMLDLINATCGLQEVIDQAVSSDGAGHFLSSYDGEEHEVTIDNETYFIYRNN